MSPSLSELERAAAQVYAILSPTPSIAWPLLAQRCGTEVFVKHENHTPIGSFKVRGGIVYLARARERDPALSGVIAATRGNHGQSVAYAARRLGLEATIVVPHGNSAEKNRAMQGLGAELVEHGSDFQDALEHARERAAALHLHLVPSFHPDLVLGVASWALELYRSVPPLDTLYVPIGLGSGICAALAARDALGLRTRVVGVVAERAPTYALSFERGEPVPTEGAPDTIADGLAVRVPDAAALARMRGGVERIVRVSEEEIRAAIRHYFADTKNVAEGAAAAPLAALLQEGPARAGARVGLVLTGSHIDRELYLEILSRA
jgi:threonine dehydratase